VTIRIGFAGTSAYAADCLNGLVNAGCDVALVVTQPDRPAGRRRTLTSPPAADRARTLGLPVTQPERVNDALGDLQRAGIRCMTICAYGQRVTRELLDAFVWLNLHPSLLPRWRGAAPIERAILAGDRETGVAIMLVTEPLDAGPLVSVDAFGISEDDDAGTIMTRSLATGIPRLVSAVTACHTDTLRTTPQPENGVTYAEKLTAADRILDPTLSVAAAVRRVRALSPHVGAKVALGGVPFVVWRACAASDRVAPASVTTADGRIICGFADGAVELVTLQQPGRRTLSATELLRGYRKPLAPVSAGG
jgi:methionyl-tRNA formyltransferase